MNIHYDIMLLGIGLVVFIYYRSNTLKRKLADKYNDIWNKTYDEIKANPSLIDYSDGIYNMVSKIAEDVSYKYLPDDLYWNRLDKLIFDKTIINDVLYTIVGSRVLDILEIVMNEKTDKPS